MHILSDIWQGNSIIEMVEEGTSRRLSNRCKNQPNQHKTEI